MKLLLFSIILSLVESIYGGSPSTRYLATVHQSSAEFLHAKRAVEASQFEGDLIFNNTLNDNGEATIKICDITQDLFNSIPSLTLFDYDRTAGVDNLASAELKATLQANLKIGGCLVFFFNPCCKTFGLRIELNEPVVVSATGSLNVEVKAFSFGVSAGSNNIDINPLNNVNLAGFSPEIGSWNLPPILDKFIDASAKGFCAPLSFPGTSTGVNFCVKLNNFTAVPSGVSVCPRLSISWGSQTLFDVSYTAVAQSKLPECITLPFFPICSYQGSPVSADIVTLFKSADSNNDQIMSHKEMTNTIALLSGSGAKTPQSFSEMDANNDGEVTFPEFQKYASVQQAALNQSSSSSNSSSSKKTFSGGELAAAIIVSIVGTILLVGGILAAVGYFKGYTVTKK